MVTRIAPSDPVELLRKTGSLLEGEFVLSSGERSTFYFDSKLLTLDPEGYQFVGKYFIDMLKQSRARAVGGMAHGAIPIVASVIGVSCTEGHPLPGFFVRQDAKSHGTLKQIEGNFPKDKSVPVAIIDDVVTSGGSILQAIDAVEAQGNPITDVFCILDRDEGGREALRDRGYNLKAMYTVVRDEKGGRRIVFNQ